MTEHEIIILLQEAFANKKYRKEIPIELILGAVNRKDLADVIIKAGGKKLAAIQIVRSTAIERLASTFVTELYFNYNIRYYVYTDGKIFLVFDRFDDPKKSKVLDLKKFVLQINTPIGSKYLNAIKTRVSEMFIEEYSNYRGENPQLRKYLHEQQTRIQHELKLSSSYELFFEGAKENSQSFEQWFFRYLVDNQLNVNAKFYRYCSFNRAFDVACNNSIAMHGLPGMNDTTEPNYVDNYINSSNEKVWEMSDRSREAINNRFIISCTTIRDELLPWRLYGEDGKGACIEFNVKENSNKKFYLGLVKYADTRGKIPELDYLKALVKRIKDDLLLDIRFVLLYVWRHFFKPNGYEYEKEVRLLYVHEKKDALPEKRWLVAEPYAIVNPFVVFNFNEPNFPIDISEIILGPKKSEIDLNTSQLKQMLLEKRKTYTITKSSVQVYR
jgi:hypothetical protein